MKTYLINFLILLSILPAVSLAQVDPLATKETKKLYQRLMNLSSNYKVSQKILLGQQNAYNEGRGWRHSDENLGAPLESDMGKTSGIHPAVYGLDFGEINDLNRNFLIERIKLANEKGGVFTLSWHMRSFIDDGKGDGNYNDISAKVVNRILPGGDHHDEFRKSLDSLANFLKSISNVPVILRLFHEHNWSLFWWGAKHCTKDEYKSIVKFSINYLHSLGVHNFLTAYSPINVEDDYLDRYPGDDVIDILGVDMYFRNKLFDLFEHNIVSPQEHWKKAVIALMRHASDRKKIPAITEFGQEGIYYEKFWTDYFGWPLHKNGILQLVKASDLPSMGIAYIMLWRNDISSPKHFYGPFPGHYQNNNFADMLSFGIFEGVNAK